MSKIEIKTSEDIDDYNTLISEERRKDCQKIEEDTRDLAETQFLLSNIVQEQSKYINDAEENLETVIIDQDDALDCLKQRSNYDDRKTKTWIALGFGAASALIIAALAIKPRR